MTGISADQLQRSIKARQAQIDELEQQDTHPAELMKLKDELGQMIKQLHELQKHPAGLTDSSDR